MANRSIVSGLVGVGLLVVGFLAGSVQLSPSTYAQEAEALVSADFVVVQGYPHGSKNKLLYYVVRSDGSAVSVKPTAN